jgi:hypothetical protein
MRDSYIHDAFFQVCKEAINTEEWYVSLMQHEQYYGGPEEGGWWGTDTHVVAFKVYPSEQLADDAKTLIAKLAEELTIECQKEHGQQCLREMDWLEARGLDADWLPEPDGPTRYSVIVSQGIPEETRGPRHYE